MKKKQNGMYGLLAVIALMLAASIYASCSSDDDTWDSSSLGELETMAEGEMNIGGESGNEDPNNEDSITIGSYRVRAGDTTITHSFIQSNLEIQVKYSWESGLAENMQIRSEIKEIDNPDGVTIKGIDYIRKGFLNTHFDCVIRVIWKKNNIQKMESIEIYDDMSYYITPIVD
ncbi:MAG: hypothetical protein MJY95_03610 [Bacteroidaceae bacterium]|nr:hypothetical protein [Bacteroidaceae bacterium]